MGSTCTPGVLRHGNQASPPQRGSCHTLDNHSLVGQYHIKLHVLTSVGILGNDYYWIDSKRSISGESSTWSDVSSGIAQGSVLDLVLFVDHINTMVESVTDSELYLFADDAKVYHIINNEQDSLELQADLDRMCKWSESSLLRFHTHKKNVRGWELGGQPRITGKITSWMASNYRPTKQRTFP